MARGSEIELIEHDGFRERFNDVTDPEECRNIELAILDIRNHPYAVSRSFRAQYEGRRWHIRGNKYRIVFAICAECIGNGLVDLIDCDDCEEIHGQDQADPQPVIKLIHLQDISQKRRAS